ncbi:MAG: Inner membrane protein YecN [Alphaproteobacteria bacterium MarineAlpha6_Bin6]|nr:MAG: Inner membrane protein YecN [Alphaproteobacteria bacterium MarineAlpha6_Bin6]
MFFHSFIYVAISLFILYRISINVIIYRRKHKVSLGDKGHEDLERRIRAQGNFTEFTPVFLISLIGIEWIGSMKEIPYYLIYTHTLGIIFVLGRLFHIKGMYDGSIFFRRNGMRITFYSLILNGLALIISIFY